MIEFLIAVWYVIGFIGYIYIATKHEDYEISHIPISILIALLGPVTLIIYFFIFSNIPKIVIFKKRK